MPTQFPATIELSDLNGSNGFKLNGISASDGSGWSVASAGDINSDGFVDLILGAPGADPNFSAAGQSYVVFGATCVGSMGVIELSSLNGINGFKLNGIAFDDLSGNAVASGGDVNADNITDIIIAARYAGPNGAHSGQSYVVFGNKNVGASGTVELSNLNGTNGFKINGISEGDFSGVSVASLVDINSDGISDIIIGAFKSSVNGKDSGQSYVVFGEPCVGSNGIFELSNLNGLNGFKINGNAYDDAGVSVASAGDVNNDGATDIIVGAYDASPNGMHSGQSYVIFNNDTIGRSGIVELSNIDGNNGFVLDGIAGNDDESGLSVASIDDFNDDGVSDLIIGAPESSPNGHTSGQSYLIFGGTNVGHSGLIELSNLNGDNGFMINGIGTNDNSGYSVSALDDFNGDDIADIIIGGPYALSHGVISGQAYVIFGGNNVGSTGTIEISNLNGLNGFIINGISEYSKCGQSVASAGDVNNDGATDIIIGAPRSNVNGKYSGQSYVIFGDFQNLNLTNNQFSLSQGQRLRVNQTNLNATSTHYPDGILQFIISDVYHGQFEYSSNPGVAITQFYQENVTNSQVQFVQDGSIHSPAFNVSAFTGRWVQTVPEPAKIYFDPLLLVNNQLTINQGETVILSKTNLMASSKGINDNRLHFTIESLQYGWFEDIAGGQPLYNFNQEQVNNHNIKFVQDGSPHAPIYQVIVNDETYTLPALTSNVTFYSAPNLNVNSLTIKQGQSVILNKNNLQATDKYVPENELIFSMSAVESGRFSLVAQPDKTVTEFTQEQLGFLTIQFTQDGSAQAPKYNVTVVANKISSAPSAAVINWTPDKITKSNNKYRNILIGTSSSVGFIGCLLLCYISMGLLKKFRLNNVINNKSGNEKQYYKETILPLAREVFSQIKITGFMNYISIKQTEAYVESIAKIAYQLRELGVNIQLQQIEPEQKTRLVHEIIKQVKDNLQIQTGRCNPAYFASFFKPQVIPEQISQKAQAIAESVHDALLGENKAGIINLPANVDLTSVVGQAPAEGEFTTRYVQMQ